MTTIAINFEKQCQQVWKTSDINQKKELLLLMINDFKFKKNQELFRRKVHNETNVQRLDKLASDIMLSDTDKVIKI